MTHAEAIAERMPDVGSGSRARYAALAAQWTQLRLQLRAEPSEDVQRQFDVLTAKLRKISKDLGLKTADVTGSQVRRVGTIATSPPTQSPGSPAS